MKIDIKESLQFILQHNAIGSPLVQHAQNLARHITSQHYEAMTANEEYPSGSDNGLQWARDLETSPQVMDEQIVDALQATLDTASFSRLLNGDPTSIGLDTLRVFGRALLSAPPAAAAASQDEYPTGSDNGLQWLRDSEAKPVAADLRTGGMNSAVRKVLIHHKLLSRSDGVIEADLIYAVLDEITNTQIAAVPQEQAPADKDAVSWAASKWDDEVANRPLVNIHRRALDDTWRQVIRHFGGDDVSLCGPRHDDLLILQSQPQQVTDGEDK